METIRPRIFISRCLGFEHCRWNGEMITDDFVECLKSRVEVIHACPEMAIGLGCPRDPVRVVMVDGIPELFQPASGKVWGASMRAWASEYIPTLPANIDGFILKSRSPSCGWKDVKVYHSVKPESGAGIGAGLFGSAVLTAFGTRPIEDEGRLKNFVIRERFLGAIFTLARFRIVEQSHDPAALVDFHTKHKYFLMLYSEKEMRALGRIVANHEHLALPEVLRAYRAGLERALAAMPRYTALINVVQHAFGGFSDSLSREEKRYFQNLVEQYRDERIPASVLLSVLYGWAIRFGERYLLDQVLFSPYPLDLVQITDSGKGRSG
ncbi:MAG: DUF523 and DUF1722 domain-containing protein [Spirochaetales bacterium]|nr:DUF523 and DUF1722 domain-containing protein [Spirochaetales bacterium]